MKHRLTLLLLLISFVNIAVAQLTHGGTLNQFTSCPDENIIAFKNGTGCTAAPYNFYRTDLNGNFIGASLFSTTNTQEINAFGISNVDKFIYGFLFDRTPTCVFQNVHFIRLGANGVYDDLGTIDLPAGYTLNTANGCTTQDGNFIFSAFNGTGFYAAIVSNVTAMTDNSSYLIPVSLRLITFNTIATKFSDWAVHPYNGRIYTYGMFTENGKSKGQMIEIDLTSNQANPMGNIDSVLLTDPTRDNFGGVFFGQDNNLYGANVFDRKLYKVDFATGALSVAGTFAAGSGQIRCDMGSCASGLLLLPLHISDVTMTENNKVLQFTWKVNDAAANTSTDIEQSSNGINFTTLATTRNTSYSLSSPLTNYFYRLRVNGSASNTIYSQVLVYKTKGAGITIRHFSDLLTVTTENSLSPVKVSVFSITGSLLKQQVFSGALTYTTPVLNLPSSSIIIVKIIQGSNILAQKVQW